MQIDVADLRPTIVPKSDQLNAEQLLGGTMTITVTDVRTSMSEEQPVSVHYEGENGRPFKPCKTMRKVLIFAWGEDGRKWIGRAMKLYNDPAVRFGGAEVGGIRISHLSDIDRDLHVSLTATKGKKAPHVIKRMDRPAAKTVEDVIASCDTVEDLRATFGTAYKAARDAAMRARTKSAYDKRLIELTKPPIEDAKSIRDFMSDIDGASDADTATLALDEARDVLSAAELEELAAYWRKAWPRA
jgi:hypothetical protein